MVLDESIISFATFAWAFNKIKPAQVVDKLIEILVKVVTPGRGTGESSWWMKGIRSIGQSAEKAQREMEIRANLRQWDEEFPFMHHEMIVRYAAGFLASSVAVMIYDTIRGLRKKA
mmetsp:Transcript_1895/g.2725  ORF Transcript_1895/g.2725 Transcript_1895/m.2725 type:complete len:116 (+) Transcript_1895:39-386(+)